MIIFDTSVILAMIYQENGSEKAKQICLQAQKEKQSIFIHQINFVEVIYKLAQKYEETRVAELTSQFSSPWWGIVNVLDAEMALIAAALKKRSPFISLGDSIGLAWTKVNSGTFWTADRALAEVGEKEQIDVQLIR